eukprot:758541-Pelagomonas_calceolata.AAC.2
MSAAARCDRPPNNNSHSPATLSLCIKTRHATLLLLCNPDLSAVRQHVRGALSCRRRIMRQRVRGVGLTHERPEGPRERCATGQHARGMSHAAQSRGP